MVWRRAVGVGNSPAPTARYRKGTTDHRNLHSINRKLVVWYLAAVTGFRR